MYLVFNKEMVGHKNNFLFIEGDERMALLVIKIVLNV